MLVDQYGLDIPRADADYGLGGCIASLAREDLRRLAERFSRCRPSLLCDPYGRAIQTPGEVIGSTITVKRPKRYADSL